MLNNIQPSVNISAQRRRLEIDVSLYDAMLDQHSVTDEAKREFLTSLWTIITAFVELGYGVHPVDQSEDEQTSFETTNFMHAAE